MMVRRCKARGRYHFTNLPTGKRTKAVQYQKPDEICKQFERNSIYAGSSAPKRVDAFFKIIAQTEDNIGSGSADGRKAERVLEQRLCQVRRSCAELEDRLEAVETKVG